MTEIALCIQSWESLNGTTWAICEYHAILSMHKSLEEAQARLGEIKRSREERERKWASPNDEVDQP